MKLLLDNYEVVGKLGILVKLEEFDNEIREENGIVTLRMENYETDGGRTSSRPSHEKYCPVGTVIQISRKAQEELDELKIDLKPDDKVAIFPNMIQHTRWFIVDKTAPVAQHEGYVLASADSIQCKIKN